MDSHFDDKTISWPIVKIVTYIPQNTLDAISYPSPNLSWTTLVKALPTCAQMIQMIRFDKKGAL